jgi:hypothetical protein
MREQHRGQAPMAVGLHRIQEDWCFYPNPAQRVSSALGNVPSPTAGKAPSPGGPFFYFFTFLLLFLGHLHQVIFSFCDWSKTCVDVLGVYDLSTTERYEPRLVCPTPLMRCTVGLGHGVPQAQSGPI